MLLLMQQSFLLLSRAPLLQRSRDISCHDGGYWPGPFHRIASCLMGLAIAKIHLTRHQCKWVKPQMHIRFRVDMQAYKAQTDQDLRRLTVCACVHCLVLHAWMHRQLLCRGKLSTAIRAGNTSSCKGKGLPGSTPCLSRSPSPQLTRSDWLHRL